MKKLAIAGLANPDKIYYTFNKSELIEILYKHLNKRYPTVEETKRLHVRVKDEHSVDLVESLLIATSKIQCVCPICNKINVVEAYIVGIVCNNEQCGASFIRKDFDFKKGES